MLIDEELIEEKIINENTKAITGCFTFGTMNNFTNLKKFQESSIFL